MRIIFLRTVVAAVCFQFGTTLLLADDPLCLTQIEQGDSCTTTCTCRGGCDLASERNLWDPNRLSLSHLMTIRLRLMIFADDNGSNRSVSAELVEAQIDQLNIDFRDYGIRFDVDPIVIPDTCFRHMCNPSYESYCETKAYCCDPPDPQPICCESNSPQLGCDFEDYQDVIMKTTYAENPDQALHVWVPGGNNGDWSIYPWSSQAETVTGGSMLIANSVGGETCGPSNDEPCIWMTHEVGHALGLWHTFDSPEGGSNNDCYCTERAICTGDVNCEECDHTGDLCCDTPSGLGAGVGTCSSASGSDECSSYASFPTADYTNYMDYGGVGCANHFTAQQAKRMHCWVCDAVPGWIDSPDCNSNEVPDVCEITRGDSDDCDQNGVPDECQSSTMPARACCYDGDQCTVTTECHCDELSGVFVSETTTCLYGPCAMFGP